MTKTLSRATTGVSPGLASSPSPIGPRLGLAGAARAWEGMRTRIAMRVRIDGSAEPGCEMTAPSLASIFEGMA
jgi:hypothetical protein